MNTTKVEDCGAVATQVECPVRPLPEPDIRTDPCNADGTQTDYYTAVTVRRLLDAERERSAATSTTAATRRDTR